MDFKNILIIDDDVKLMDRLAFVLKDAGFGSFKADTGLNGLNLLREKEIYAILLDFKMPGMDGLECLREIKLINTEVPVIFLTAYGDIPLAVKAAKLGAYELLQKPVEPDRLVSILGKGIEDFERKKNSTRLFSPIEASLKKRIGWSKEIDRVAQQLHLAAKSNFSIIIQGETGTGKTTLAREIHHLSPRSGKPFVKVDIGTLTETLLESELFGHERGSFTGAERQKRGFLEMAQGGTLFIDEIENMTPNAQTKFLSIAEEKTFYRVGSNTPVALDFRIIAATNMDIKHLVSEKKFREDLYYRIGEFTITLPPLRARPEDIRHFAERFLYESSEELNKLVEKFDEEAMHALSSHPWPGNIRELKNTIRKAVLFSKGEILSAKDLKPFLVNLPSENDYPLLLSLKEATRRGEMKCIQDALKMTKDNKSKAASLLQISARGLYAKIKELGIDKE